MKANDFDRVFDEGGGVIDLLNLERKKRPLTKQRRVNVDIPAWMIEELGKEARRLGVTRQSIFKVWLAKRLERR